MDEAQKRSILITCGVGVRYANRRVSEYLPNALPYYDDQQWKETHQNLIIKGSDDIGALIFAGALAVKYRYDLRAVPTSMLLYYLEHDEVDEMAFIYNSEVLCLLGFCHSTRSKLSPYNAKEAQLLEGFIQTMTSRYGVTIILSVSDTELSWYSEEFKSFFMDSAIVIN